MKILIIDDDHHRASKLERYLIDNAGIDKTQILIADCRSRALNFLRELYFDVVILDVVLPKRSNERPSAQNGLELLERISRGRQLKKPEKIIGITSHLSDIDAFRNEFNKYCHTIIEASSTGDQWRDIVKEGLNYTLSSRIDRSSSLKPITALTVHGIRTFGSWQNRLKSLVSNRTGSVEFANYQYGYFSLLSFCIPFFRWIQVRRLKEKLIKTIQRDGSSRIIIFSHSFGTYLVAHALKSLIRDGYRPQIETLVLCGSVLPSSFDWDFLERSTEARIINECGDADYILWLSQALVPLSGMAGKTGFFGTNGSRIRNRYFSGGHSLYFDGDLFMTKYWIPLFDRDSEVVDIDVRVPCALRNGIGDNLISRLGSIKEIVLIGLIAYWTLKLIYI